MKNRKKPKISKVVEYLNNHLRDGNDKTVRYWLEDYLSSSYKPQEILMTDIFIGTVRFTTISIIPTTRCNPHIIQTGCL